MNCRIYSIFITQKSDKHNSEFIVHYILYIIIIQKIVQTIQQGHRKIQEKTLQATYQYGIFGVLHIQ